MKVIIVEEIVDKVRDAVQVINFDTPEPTLIRLTDIQSEEPSPTGRLAMNDIVQNRRVASQKRVPMCQDTGMVVVFVDLGELVHVKGGRLREAIINGVRQGYKQGYLRNSIVDDPIFERKNTNDNTPPVIHYELVAGDKLELTIAAKGFGAENMSWVRVLTPADGIEGVKREVVRCIEEAGPNACPPVVVGLGIGGTLEKAALLAKRALMRPMGQRNPDPRYADLEVEILKIVNATGIGPQGWGGINTAMDVRIEYYPTHIAGIPLAINLDCHLHRHTKIVI